MDKRRFIERASWATHDGDGGDDDDDDDVAVDAAIEDEVVFMMLLMLMLVQPGEKPYDDVGRRRMLTKTLVLKAK